MKSFGKIVILSIVVFLMLMSTSLVYADQPPPPCDDGQGGGSIQGCVHDVLEEENTMINEVENLLDEISNTGLLSLVRAQSEVDIQPELRARIDTIRNEHARARAVNAVTTDDDYDDMLAKSDKEQGEKCSFSDKPFYDLLVGDDGFLDPEELESIGLQSVGSKFGNEKCDIFTASDLNGDSVKVNERKENMCEKVCEDKKDSNGNSRKGESKERLRGHMVDAISSARAANRMLITQRARIAELNTLLSELRLSETGFPSSMEYVDPCDPATGDPESGYLIAELALQSTLTGVDVLTAIGDILVEVLEGAKDISEVGCEQVAMGFNAKAACGPFIVAFHIAKGINELVKSVSTGLGNAKEIVANLGEQSELNRADYAKACTKEIRDEFKTNNGTPGKIVTLQGDVATLKSDVTDLKLSAGQADAALSAIREELALLKSLMEESRNLLLVPQGKRENFNTK